LLEYYEEKMADRAAERAVLCGLFQYGEDALLDVADFLDAGSFTDPLNQAVFKCIMHLYEKKEMRQFDQTSLMACASKLGYDTFFEKAADINHIRSLMTGRVLLENVRTWGAQVRKLQVGRLLRDQLREAAMSLEDIRGTESIETILGLAETVVFDFSSLLHNDETSTPQLIGEGLMEYLDALEANPVDIVGISSGMKYYDQAIGGGFRRKTVSMIGARPKALRYGSTVYTPDGPCPIEHIVVGDKILHPFEGTTYATGVYDHPHTQIYRVLFRDGDFVDCCGDHLWEVYKRYPCKLLEQKTPYHKTTKDLMGDLHIGNQQEHKWDIRLPSPTQFNHKDVVLDPYVLGLLIGDGSFRNAITFSTGDAELIQYIKLTLSNDIKLEIDTPTCKTYRINGLQNTIRQLGLYKIKALHKFIPHDYIYNDIDVRLEILRGLLDTDGDCTLDTRSKQSRSRYSTISLELAKNVQTIVQSLGGLCSINKQVGQYNDKPHLSYRCEIRLPEQYNPFKLTRKHKLHTDRKIGELKRTIVDITPMGVDNARCITVENNDGLFMTDNFIVTHNTGKSMLAANIGLHIAGQINIPVLYLDTEMVKEDHWSRMLPNLCLRAGAQVTITELETGQYSITNHKQESVRAAAAILVGDEQNPPMPFHYLNVSGKPFEEIVSIMRRWVTKEVGFDEEGNRNNCIILYDYMKMMTGDSLNSSMKEYQVLGFMMSALHNFTVRHDVPVLSFIQLNRDGIDRESTDIISGSDRVLWLVTNFTVYKFKSAEEIADTGPQYGNCKLVPISARHGEGLSPGDYINIRFEGRFGSIQEGETKSRVKQREKENHPVNDADHVPFDQESDESVQPSPSKSGN